MNVESLLPGWNGVRWKRWTLLGGTLAVPVAVLIAGIASLASGERLVPLILLALVAIILGGSLIGSGIIDTLAGQMNRGGLARESTDHINRSLEEMSVEDHEAQAKAHRDRRTLRSGIFIVPSIIAFVFFMTLV